MQKNLSEILKKREEIFSDWSKLNSMDAVPSYLNLTLLDCRHFSVPMPTSSTVLPSCMFCNFENNLTNYESLLCHAPVESNYDAEDRRIKSSMESILEVIHNFAMKYQVPANILKNGTRHITQFRYLEKEIQVNLSEFQYWYPVLRSQFHSSLKIGVSKLMNMQAQ